MPIQPLSFYTTLLIAMFPVLALYDFIPLLSVGFFILLLIILVRLIRQRLVIRANLDIFYMMVVFLILNFLIGLLKYADLTNTINNSGGIIVFAVFAMFLACPGTIDIDYLYKACRIVAFVATAFLLVQTIGYHIFGIVIEGLVPSLKTIEEVFQSINYGRPNSIFFEPAHYCIYVAPVYAMALIRRETKTFLILGAGIIMSTSTTGILLMLIIPLLIYYRKAKVMGFLLLFVMMFLLGILILPDLINEYLSKLTPQSLSENIRIVGTLGLFAYFGLPEWIFGVGINRLAEFVVLNGGTYAINYANSIFFMVLSFGLLGGAVFVVFLVRLFKRIKPDYRVFFYILLFILISDQVLFNRNLLYLLIWIEAVTLEAWSLKEERLPLESSSWQLGRIE
jgi:hypothetical protein